MPLASSADSRTPLHTRSIEVQAFERPDGLFDLDALLKDVKPFDTPLEAGIRPAGLPIHAMRLRVTIDLGFEIRDIHAVSDAVPYEGHCDTIAPDYRKLVGANLLKGFRHTVRDRMGETRGCTHMSELALVLPTAAVQALAARLHAVNEREGSRPFQIDRCHAMASGSEAVRRYYPQWYRKPTAHRAGPDNPTSNDEATR